MKTEPIIGQYLEPINTKWIGIRTINGEVGEDQPIPPGEYTVVLGPELPDFKVVDCKVHQFVESSSGDANFCEICGLIEVKQSIRENSG